MKRTLGLSLLVLFGISVPALAEQMAAPAKTAAAATAVQAAAPETILVDDDLPANAKPQADWLWDTITFTSGKKSHGHPSAKGLQGHGFTSDPIAIPANGMITQQVWLDPKDPPKGIMLKFRLASGEEVGVYWEGEEEVFFPKEDEEVWYYGLLPEFGKWTTLEVLAEDLGLEEEKVTGITYVTFDGRVLWDKTGLKIVPPAEEPAEAFPDIIPSMKSGEKKAPPQ